MAEQLLVRFRHTQGDIGPLSLPFNSTVQAAKERLFTSWPKGILVNSSVPFLPSLICSVPMLLRIPYIYCKALNEGVEGCAVWRSEQGLALQCVVRGPFRRASSTVLQKDWTTKQDQRSPFIACLIIVQISMCVCKMDHSVRGAQIRQATSG